MSLIQAQVLALMSRDHMQDLAHPTEAEAVQLVRAGLYLLLEIGQRVSMQQVQPAARCPPPRPPSSAYRRACARPRPHALPATPVAPRYWSARGVPISSRAPATSSAAKCTPTCGRSCYLPRCCRTRSRRPRAARQVAQADALKRTHLHELSRRAPGMEFCREKKTSLCSVSSAQPPAPAKLKVANVVRSRPPPTYSLNDDGEATRQADGTAILSASDAA